MVSSEGNFSTNLLPAFSSVLFNGLTLHITLMVSSAEPAGSVIMKNKFLYALCFFLKITPELFYSNCCPCVKRDVCSFCQEKILTNLQSVRNQSPNSLLCEERMYMQRCKVLPLTLAPIFDKE